MPADWELNQAGWWKGSPRDAWVSRWPEALGKVSIGCVICHRSKRSSRNPPRTAGCWASSKARTPSSADLLALPPKETTLRSSALVEALSSPIPASQEWCSPPGVPPPWGGRRGSAFPLARRSRKCKCGSWKPAGSWLRAPWGRGSARAPARGGKGGAGGEGADCETRSRRINAAVAVDRTILGLGGGVPGATGGPRRWGGGGA